MNGTTSFIVDTAPAMTLSVVERPANLQMMIVVVA
jgi:hypothetical protein